MGDSPSGRQPNCKGQQCAPNSLDAHVGLRTRLRRMMIGISEAQLAQQLGRTPEQITDMEHGRIRISAVELCAVSRALRVPVMWFYEQLEQERSRGAPADPAATRDDEQRSLLWYFDRMTPAMRSKLLLIAAALAANEP
jgi:transcriptional regulator with XRE-family HTH domain